MKPIPFSDLTTSDENRLARRYGMRRELAVLIARHPVARRSDLLDRDDVVSMATPTELRILTRESRVDPDPPETESVQRSASVTYRGAVLGLYERESSQRAYLADAGGEIISAELDPDSPLGIRVSTAKLLGWSLAELGVLDPTLCEKGRVRLDELRAFRVHELWREKELPRPDGAPALAYQVLSALFDGVLHMTRSLDDSAAATGGVTPGGGVPGPSSGPITTPVEDNGAQCGPGNGWLADLVPELNIHECCVAHDACYAEGCTSCDRAKCDAEFYECILPKAGPTIAALYYNAVAAFGQSAFTYCDGSWGLGGFIAVGVSVAIGVGVGIVAGIGWGLVAAAAATGISILVHSLLCRVCEKVEEWECTAWEDRKRRECSRRERERKKKCRKWSRWTRWICRAWNKLRKWFCVAWTWVVTRLCTAGQWIIVKVVC